MRSFELQGHRGARGLFAENTLPGFAAAMAVGIDSIELDIAVTADGVAVVVHDPVLNADLTRGPDGAFLRQAGPAVVRLTLAQLSRYDVGRARPASPAALAHPCQQSFDGATIPTLDAVLALTAASGLRIDAELKTDPARPDLAVSPQAMAEAVMAAAKARDAASRLVVRSFDWRGLHHLQKAYPDLALAWLTDRAAGLDTPERVAVAAGAARVQPTWAPHFAALSEASLARAHGLGLRVVPWTVNAAADLADLVSLGVDGVCTDRPDLARAAMRTAGLPLPPCR